MLISEMNMFLNLNLPNTPDREPYPLDFRTLPPHHNPMICAEPMGTLDNVHSTLKLLIRLILDSEQMELNYSERETRGLLCVLECLADAMQFELYHRIDTEADEDETEAVTGNTVIG